MTQDNVFFFFTQVKTTFRILTGNTRMPETMPARSIRPKLMPVIEEEVMEEGPPCDCTGIQIYSFFQTYRPVIGYLGNPERVFQSRKGAMMGI